MIVVTHYQRLLDYIVPDFVHVLVDGRIVRSGGKEMALELEEKGYAWLEKEPAAAPAAGRGRRHDRRSPRTRTRCARASSASPRPTPLATPPGCASGARPRSRASSRRACPRPRDEAWRHTPLGPLARARFEPADARGDPDPGVLAPCPRDGLAGASTSSSSTGASRPSSRRRTAGQPRRRGREPARPAARRSRRGRRAVARPRARTSAAAPSPTSTPPSPRTARSCVIAPGAVVEASRSTSLHVAAPAGRPRVAYLRTLVVAGRGSESRRGRDLRRRPTAAATSTNAVTEVVVGDGARVDHYKLQREGGRGAPRGDARRAALGRDARFSDHAVSLGAALSRNDIDVASTARAASARSTGSSWLDGAPRLPTPTRGSTTRRRTARAASSTRASSTARRAASSTAWWWCAPARRRPTPCRRTGTCCSPARRSSTRRRSSRSCADDVKCKHGSTTGQLDAERPLLPALARDRRGRRRAASSPGPSRATSSRELAVEPPCAARSSASCRRGSPGVARAGGGAAVSDAADAAAAPRLDVEAVRREFPILGETRPRQAPRLPRQRRHAPRSRGRSSTPSAASTSAATPTSTAASTASRCWRRDAYESGAREGAALPGAAETPRDRLRPRHHRGHQPRRPELRPQARRRRATRSWSPRLEHHSNIVPWQMLCEEKGARLRVAPIDDAGEVDLEAFERLLSPRTRIVAVAHVSNALGTVNPVRRMIGARARRGRGGAGRRRAGGAAPGGRRAGARLRLLRLLRPQGVRPDRASASSTARRGAARGHAALAGRRRHDPLRHLREDHLERAALQVRGGHARTSRARIALGAALD